MTLNDIKIEALKLMFTNYSEDIYDVTELTNDDNYSAYIMSMNGAINRALARMFSKKVIRKKFKPLATSYADVDNGVEIEDAISITLSEEDIAALRLQMVADNPDVTEQEIEAEINRINAENRVSIPVDAQMLIPYYIKADLYQEDEPAIATQARNYFEQGLDDRWYDEEQEVVENVFRQGWLG